MTDQPPLYRNPGSRFRKVCALVRLPDLQGQVVLVTGGTDGVGRALVDQLATTGATVVMTARDAAKGERVRADVVRASGNHKIHVVPLDLASLASVRSGALAVLDGWDRLDVVICNAAHQAGADRTVTSDGFEMTFGVNHLGHALLVQLLEQRLGDSAPSRVVVVASEAHRRSRGGLDFDDLMMTASPFRPRVAYSRSKLANVLFALELARRLEGSGVDVSAVHPGAVDTLMMRANFRRPVTRPLYWLLRQLLLISPDDAAAGVLRVALDPELAGQSGGYFEIGAPEQPAPEALDGAAALRLWEVTSGLVGTR